jgi:hypothetical protein
MGKRLIYILTVIALIIAILQKTPLAFLNEHAADFVWGGTIGLAIGSIVTWLSERE